MTVENSGLSFDRWDRMDSENGSSNQLKSYSKIFDILLSPYIDRIEGELKRVVLNRPLKINDLQTYYTFRAREEQLKFESAYLKSFQELLNGHLVSACLLYRSCIHHLHQRTGFEQKVYKVWLERIKAKKNPPTPDIMFINQGTSLNQLI